MALLITLHNPRIENNKFGSLVESNNIGLALQTYGSIFQMDFIDSFHEFRGPCIVLTLLNKMALLVKFLQDKGFKPIMSP